MVLGGSGTINATSTFALQANNANRINIDSSGNVGIGTTTPLANVHITGSSWDNANGGTVIVESNTAVGVGITLKPMSSAIANGSNGWSLYAGSTGSAIGDGSIGFWSHALSKSGATYPNAWFVNKNGYMLVRNQPACLIACQANDIQWTSGNIVNFYGSSGAGNVSTTVFDNTNSFNTTNSRFTAPVTGTYFFGATVNGYSTGTVPRARFRVNGASIGNDVHFRGNSSLTSDLDQRTMSIIYKLSAGDYVDFYVFEGRFDTFGANYFCAYLLG